MQASLSFVAHRHDSSSSVLIERSTSIDPFLLFRCPNMIYGIQNKVCGTDACMDYTLCFTQDPYIAKSRRLEMPVTSNVCDIGFKISRQRVASKALPCAVIYLPQACTKPISEISMHMTKIQAFQATTQASHVFKSNMSCLGCRDW